MDAVRAVVPLPYSNVCLFFEVPYRVGGTVSLFFQYSLSEVSYKIVAGKFMRYGGERGGNPRISRHTPWGGPAGRALGQQERQAQQITIAVATETEEDEDKTKTKT